MEYKGASCPLHVKPHKPWKVFVRWQIFRKQNLSHVISSLPSQSPKDRNASGLRPAPRNSRNWQRKPEILSLSNFGTLHLTCAKDHVEEGEENGGGRLHRHLFVSIFICNSTEEVVIVIVLCHKFLLILWQHTGDSHGPGSSRGWICR